LKRVLSARSPLTLALSQRERGLTELSWLFTSTCDFSGDLGLAKPENTLIFQVDVVQKGNSVGSLSPRERAGVRAAVISHPLTQKIHTIPVNHSVDNMFAPLPTPYNPSPPALRSKNNQPNSRFFRSFSQEQLSDLPPISVGASVDKMFAIR